MLIANRGFFPSSVIESAREDMRKALGKAGAEVLEMDPSLTRFGAVETQAEGALYARFLADHHGQYDGLVVCLPNFGDENGVKEAIKDARVPILLQAYPDEIGKMDFAHRRDSLCGKLALCSVLRQMKVPFTSGEPFVMDPLSGEFGRELDDFIAICRIVKRMRHARIGVLGARTTAFKSVRFDEGAFEERGTDIETLDMSQVFERIRDLDDGDPRLKEWRRDLERISDMGDTPEYAIANQCKLAVAIDDLRKEMALDALAVRCWSELQHEFKITPCAIMGIMGGSGIPVACETDGSNAAAMVALAAASDGPVGCLDINNNYGAELDKCIMFHCGPLPIGLLTKPGHMEEHKMFVKTQGDNCSWGVNVGRIRPGAVTICGMRTEKGEVRYFLEEAEVVDAPVDEGFFGTSGVVRVPDLQRKLRRMSEEGFRHHAIIARGHRARPIREALSKYLGYTEIAL